METSDAANVRQRKSKILEETLKEDDVSTAKHEKKKPVSTEDRCDQLEKTPLQFNLSFDGVSVLLFLVSLATRIWHLESPKGVVFDELHYAKYAGLYMKNTFFFDSQPPLGKQLIALAAYVAGFDGSFKFERIGTPYDGTVPVVAMRLVPAFFGSLLMPTIYNLLLELGLSHKAGFLAAFLLIFENALLTQSRYILMEGILLFFSIFGLLCTLKFRRFYGHPFCFQWFLYIILAVTSLSAAVCVRYFGIFTFFLAVFIVLKDVWDMVADSHVSDLQLAVQFLSRGFFFCTIPVILYFSCFYLHLSVLYKAGPNDNIMTSAFQASLEGGLAAIVANQPSKVVHGSQVTLRHTHGRTCWLHSHEAVYPVKYSDGRGSSHQQQVTCYSYKDVNNWWIIKKPEVDELVVSEPMEPIMSGDIVQIVHGLTSRALNSHDVAAPLSPHNQEVSCYIDYNVSMPAQDMWRVEILNAADTDGFWNAVDSQVRLIHVNSTTALRFSGLQLPDWGYRQHEVVTDKLLEQDDTVWNVEEHRYSRTDDKKEREKELMRQEMIPTEKRNLTFWNKLYELQYKMLFNNQENVAGHMYASEPLDWLTLKRGVAYWVNSASNAQVHLIGNVVIWLSGTLGLVAFGALFLFYIMRRQRDVYDLSEDTWNQFCMCGEVLGLGYVLNYLPYFLVDRTLFLHHYLPAYIFKICLLATVVEHVNIILKKHFPSFISACYMSLVLVWMSAAVYVFYLFAPVVYGNVDLTPEQVMSLAWRDTWDLIIHKQ